MIQADTPPLKNAQTAAILKQMGFLQSGEDAGPSGDGSIFYFIPRTGYRVGVLPTTSPEGLLILLWEAGGEARRAEICKGYEAFVEALKR